MAAVLSDGPFATPGRARLPEAGGPGRYGPSEITNGLASSIAPALPAWRTTSAFMP
jgi:hypothetical protein